MYVSLTIRSAQRGPLAVLLDVGLGQRDLPGQVVELPAGTCRLSASGGRPPATAASGARAGSDVDAR